MADKTHPCAKGLTEECIKKYPQWAVKVFAYKLLHTLLPKEISKNLPHPLNLPMIGSGAIIPEGLVIPPGYVIPPDYDASDISNISDLPSSFSPEGESHISVDPNTGALPPENFSFLASTPVPGASQVTTGTLDVSSSPAGATVKIDTVVKGVTPLSIVLDPGSYALVLSLAGYLDHSETISIVTGETTTVSVTMIQIYDFEKLSEIALGSGENRNEVIFIEPSQNLLYIPTYDPQNVQRRINCATDTLYGYVNQGVIGQSTCGVVDGVNRKLYVGVATSPGKIIKFDLAGMTNGTNITLNAGENDIRGCAQQVHNGKAYFLCNTIPGKIVKIDLASFAREACLTLQSGFNSPWDAVIDTVDNKMYVVLKSAAKKIVKIDLSTFAVEASLGVPVLVNMAVKIRISKVNDELLSFGDTSGKGCCKTKISTFTNIAALDYDEGSDAIMGVEYIESAQFAFVTCYGTSGKILKIDTQAMALIDVLDIHLTNTLLSGIVYNPLKNKLYVSQDSSPVVVLTIGTGDIS